MSYSPGATILIVYYVLKEKGKLKEWFRPSELIEWYRSSMDVEEHRTLIIGLAKTFKKHHGTDIPLAFHDSMRMQHWLDLHVDKKERFWFERNGLEYRIKIKYIDELDGYIP